MLNGCYIIILLNCGPAIPYTYWYWCISGSVTACSQDTWGVACANQCTCGFNVAECSPVDGCTVCKAGWKAGVYNCVEDINECENAADNNCDMTLSTCNNLDATYECLCKAGYHMVDDTCVGRWHPLLAPDTIAIIYTLIYVYIN